MTKRDYKKSKARLNRKLSTIAGLLSDKGISIKRYDFYHIVGECYAIYGRKLRAKYSLAGKHYHASECIKLLSGVRTTAPKQKSCLRRSEYSIERQIKFYRSRAWRRKRYEALKRDKGLCQLCGRGRKDGVVLHVDHIEPLSRNWNRRLDLSNLQVLCEDCNMGKGGTDETDWR